jgi:AcrR family transcriptional regulator
MNRREQQRQSTLDEIKTVARRQMAREGTGALSLRAIAAEMGVTAPALYRYYANRDDLITPRRCAPDCWLTASGRWNTA